MKVISILQPWASLIVHGHKKIETRSWNTKYRGEILIHASMGENKAGYDLWHSKCWDTVADGKHFAELPFGAIIGKANLVSTIHTAQYFLEGDSIEETLTHKAKTIKKQIWEITEQELAFGDYSPNRFGWLLSDPVVFAEPIPAKGKLGLWEYDVPFRKEDTAFLDQLAGLAVQQVLNKMPEM